MKIILNRVVYLWRGMTGKLHDRDHYPLGAVAAAPLGRDRILYAYGQEVRGIVDLVMRVHH